jgi:hypothetical protein
MVFNAKPAGRREVGRPRLRWLDDEADIKALGVKTWRTFNVPRFKWPVLLCGPDLNARIMAAGACFY